MQPILGNILAKCMGLMVTMGTSTIVLADYKTLALQAESENNYVLAEELWRRALSIAREEKHQASILNELLERLSCLHERTGNLEAAIQTALESFALKQVAFGSKSTTVAAAADRLASLYFRAGDGKTSIRYGLLCLEGLEATFGKFSEPVATASLNLATVQFTRRKFAEAEKHLNYALNARLKVYGAQHEKTVQVAAYHADLLRKMHPEPTKNQIGFDATSTTADEKTTRQSCDFCGTKLPQGSDTCLQCHTVAGQPFF